VLSAGLGADSGVVMEILRKGWRTAHYRTDRFAVEVWSTRPSQVPWACAHPRSSGYSTTSILRLAARGADEPIFTNRLGKPLHASGVRLRLRKYVTAAERLHPHLREKRVAPHTFRHTAAVHLVAAGVDVTVIQSWLGHAHLDTTFLYARANVETKQQALEQVDGIARPSRPPRWRRDAGLMAWLDSL